MKPALLVTNAPTEVEIKRALYRRCFGVEMPGEISGIKELENKERLRLRPFKIMTMKSFWIGLITGAAFVASLVFLFL